MRYIYALMVLSLSFTSGANTNNAKGTITGVTVGIDFARVKSTDMTAAEGCTDQNWYMIDLNEDTHKALFNTVLSAKMSGASARFLLSGCHRNAPKIIHVYLCETDTCE